MEDKIKQILKEYGLTENQLTKEELEQLKLRKQGFEILDGVLSNPGLFYRQK